MRSFVCLLKFDTGLFFDASQCANGQIPFGMRNSDAAFLDGMSERLVAASLSHLDPAIYLKRFDNVPTFHVYLYVFPEGASSGDMH